MFEGFDNDSKSFERFSEAKRLKIIIILTLVKKSRCIRSFWRN